MPMMMNDDDLEPSPFDGCAGIDEIMFMILDHGGPKALRELLDLLTDEDVDRETLEQAAEGMAAAGLPQAAMVLEAAAQIAPKQDDTEIEAILSDPNPHNRKAGMAALHRRHARVVRDSA